MSGLRFEWHAPKAAANLRKHGVSMDEAQSAFGDPLALTLPDPDHSTGEERYITFGLSASGRLLAIARTETVRAVRIISARTVTPAEQRRYEET